MKLIRQKLSQFKDAQSGATTVEFMIVMPLIVFWFAGTFTFFDAYAKYTRSVKSTYTIADILSRQTSVDDEYITDMNRLFASLMGESENDVWLRVSSVEYVVDTFELDWSDATGYHADYTLDNEIPVEILPNLVNGESTLIIETYMPFVPIMDSVGISSSTYSNKVVVSPRFTSKLANTDAQ